MKTTELLIYVVFVAVIASLVTLVVAIFYPDELKEFEQEAFTNELPQQFTPEENAKLQILRDKTKFTASSNGLQVKMPILIQRELRITNASPTSGAIRFKRKDGTTSKVSVADTLQANQGLFTKDRQEYYLLPNARDLLITNGNKNITRIQPYTVGYKPDSPNMYLEDYPIDPITGNTHDTQYINKQDAYRECTRIVSTGGTCSGLTKNTQQNTYTLRIGTDGLKPSSYNEISTVRY
jgi:hypothetical protein